MMQNFTGYGEPPRRDSYSSAGRNDFSPDDDDDHGDNGHSGRKPDVRGNKAEKGDRKGVINRVNRACNNCRRMKMRCVGAEEPPCKRCRNSGLECVMEKPGRGSEGGVVEDNRIRSLENQVSAMQNTLSDLVTALRAGVSSGTSNASANTPGHVSSTPDFPQITQTAGPMGFRPNTSPSQNNGVVGTTQYDVQTSPFWNDTTGNTMYTGRSPGGTASGFGTMQMSGTNFGFPPRQDATPSVTQNLTSPYNNAVLPDPRTSLVHMGSFPDPTDIARRPMPPVPSHSFSWSTSQIIPKRHMSLPPSRAGSVGPEDILDAEEIINPLGAMSNMAGLVEAAVERARQESVGGPSPDFNIKRVTENTSSAEDATRPLKKARFSPTLPSGPMIVEAQNLPPIPAGVKGKAKTKRAHIHACPDVIQEGYITEEEGKALMQVYYAGSSNFIPCYDPTVDTWSSLRIRSPFSITAICMVGARVQDGGGPISDVQTACRQHAQRIAVGTLFNPVARIEAVQAMILLAAFSENGWLPGGHAVRMALDMGINRSFVHLLRSGMGKGKSPEDLEDERHLVVHSRVWFCLYLVEHQMAYGMGRPAILREDEAIHQCRRLLEHPLSITSDARLVSTVELMALRAPLHIELTAAPDLPIAENTLRRLKQANNDFDAWERYWDRVLSDRFGKLRGDFFRESLIVQRQYAELFVNSQLLRGIREPTDVVDMPDEKRILAIRAMRNAQKCIEICLRGENAQYRNGLRYAVHYTHVCAAFAASFLIRIARLFPNELNLKKTAKDVEELASVLSDIPAGRYARSLRLILRRARRAKVIPAPSAVSSPKRGLVGLNMTTESMTPFSPSQLVNSAFFPTPTPSVGAGTGGGVSPTSMLMPAGNIIDDSPTSAADLFEFDSLFAQETLERAGLTLGEGDQLPLFLDGQSLGGTQAATEMTPFVGIEHFFLPAEVDNRLGGILNGNGELGTDGNPLGGDVWW